MDNIVLIGMPGSGKSTVGVLLAKLIGFQFIDTDLLIQSKANKKLYEILRDDGAEAFTALENEINKSVTASKTVIATGGSAVYCEEAMKHLKSIGTVVFLDVPKDVLKKRLGDFSKRGVLIKNGESFEDLYNERIPLYKKYADLTVACTENDLVANAERLISALGI